MVGSRNACSGTLFQSSTFLMHPIQVHDPLAGGQGPEMARQISHSSDFSIRVPDSWLAAVFAGKLLARQRQSHTSGSQQPPQNEDA